MSSSSSPAPPLNGRHSSGDDFAGFFESWLSDQDRDLHSLLSAASSPPPPAGDGDDDDHLRHLVSSVLSRYESYYRAKQSSARRDVLPMFSPSWTSSTENLLLWAGGWRPSMTFHLLYSKSGLQLQPSLDRLIAGDAPASNLADLDADQLRRVDRLHRQTLRREKEVSEEEASAQERVADEKMVRLSQAMTEAGEGAEAMEEEMRGRREAMAEVLRKADGLRMETLRAVVEILRPMQAVHFLIAAAELHLRVHEFGTKKDQEKEPLPLPMPPAN